VYAKASLFQKGGHDSARPFLLESQFRMSMEVLAEAAQEC
jgi:hypothetical protein